MEFIGTSYNLKGPNPLATYKGHVVVEYFITEFRFKIVNGAIYAPAGEKEVKVAELFEKYAPEAYAKLETLLPETKYLTGDTLSIYDFQVAGYFCNALLNPLNPLADKWAAQWENAGPKLKAYIANF